MVFQWTWTQAVHVLMSAHGQRIARFLNRLMLHPYCGPLVDDLLLAINKWSFQALVSLRSAVSVSQRGDRALLLAHAPWCCIVGVDNLLHRLIVGAELERGGALRATPSCRRLTTHSHIEGVVVPVADDRIPVVVLAEPERTFGGLFCLNLLG